MHLFHRILASLMFTFFGGLVVAQESTEIQVLLKKLNSVKSDTTKINLLEEIGFLYEDIDLEQSIDWYNKAIALAKKKGAKNKLAKIYSSKGIVFQYLQEYDSSIVALKEGIGISEQLKDTSRAAKLYCNLGNTYFYTDQMKFAIPSYKKGLEYAKSVKLHIVTGACYRGIGNCYDKLENYSYCEKYHALALQVDRKNGFEFETAMDYSNLASLFIDQNRLQEADNYLTKSIKTFIELGVEGEHLALNYNNQASVKYKQEKYQEALELFQKAKQQFRLSKEVGSIPFANKNIASTLVHLNQADLAKVYIDSALQNFTLKNNPYIALDAKLTLAEILIKQLKHDEASKLLLQIYNEKDSVEESYQRGLLNELELKFQTKEKDLLLQKSKKDLKIKQAESERRQILIVGLAGVGLLLLLLVFYVRKANRNITKANKLIEDQNGELKHQKRMMEDTNHAIISSIRYAQNLQNAILPPNETIAEFFPRHFTIYLPKDIVAGDFYWVESMNNRVFFAVADCTGHGVPGAMVSVVCHNALNQALRNDGIMQPGALLDKARELVVKTFEKNSVNIKDGMDIALCSFDLETLELHFSGANNSLLIARGNKLIKLNANRQAIGFTESPVPFDTHAFQLKSSDRIYAFSDGFADQFGGDNDKKYKSKRMEDFIVSLQHLSMDDQKDALMREFENWKGNNEQTDDVSILGIEV